MQSQLTFGLQVRLVVAGGLNLLLFFWGLDRLGKYSTEEAQAWAHFWLAGTSFLVFALAWPMLRPQSQIRDYGDGDVADLCVIMVCGPVSVSGRAKAPAVASGGRRVHDPGVWVEGW